VTPEEEEITCRQLQETAQSEGSFAATLNEKEKGPTGKAREHVEPLDEDSEEEEEQEEIVVEEPEDHAVLEEDYREATTLQSQSNIGDANEEEAEQQAREEGADLEKDSDFKLVRECNKKLQECYIPKYNKKGKMAKKSTQIQV